MATKTWSSTVQHTNDATFRAWMTEVVTALADVGLVQTSDTGQLVISTATRPGLNVDAGYQIWRFPDSSIFLRFDFGTGGSSSTQPSIKLAAGSGTNGAGILTNASESQRVTGYSSTASPGTSSYKSFMVLKDGFFGMSMWHNAIATNFPLGACFVARSVDYNTNVTNVGFTIYWATNNTALNEMRVQAVRLNPTYLAGTSAADGSYSFTPHNMTASLVNGVPQAFAHWTQFPTVQPVFGLATLIASEMAYEVVFQANILGSTTRTYIGLQGLDGGIGSAATRIAMLWE
jgi:hypothetical protein